jgi:hypothetical protein
MKRIALNVALFLAVIPACAMTITRGITVEGSGGAGVDLLPLNNTWTGTNTFDAPITITTGTAVSGVMRVTSPTFFGAPVEFREGTTGAQFTWQVKAGTLTLQDSMSPASTWYWSSSGGQLRLGINTPPVAPADITASVIGAGAVAATTYLQGPGYNAGFIVPAGAIFLSTTTCPAGSSEVTTLAGRYLVARPAGGTINGTVGTAMGNMSNTAHDHGTITFTIGSGVNQTVGGTTGALQGDIAPYVQIVLCTPTP